MNVKSAGSYAPKAKQIFNFFNPADIIYPAKMPNALPFDNSRIKTREIKVSNNGNSAVPLFHNIIFSMAKKSKIPFLVKTNKNAGTFIAGADGLDYAVKGKAQKYKLNKDENASIILNTQTDNQFKEAIKVLNNNKINYYF